MVEAKKQKIDAKYIVEIKGKKHITFNGLLDAAYESGLDDMRIVDLQVDWEKQSAYCLAACKMNGREIMAAGSGTQSNCNDMVKAHFVEMSQTRAYARCLRTLLNIDMVALDELKDNKESKPTTFKEAGRCEDCNQPVSQKVIDFSKKNFDNKVLCINCQKKPR